NDLEFLELKNIGTNTLDLSGLTFTSGINFTFTNGTWLGPDQFFVLVRNVTAFAAKYPGVAINGSYTGQLDNSGEKLTLSNPFGETVFSVSYGDRPPWPVAPDGNDFSLVPRDPNASPAPDKGSSWRASANPGGSPGSDDPSPDIAPIAIDEILTHTDPPEKDSVELFNPTITNVDIGGWFLTDDPDTLKYRIPDDTILSPGGRVVFNEDDFNPTPGFGNSFAFSSTGDAVYLFSADTNGRLTGYSTGVAFGAVFNGVSFGRVVNSAGEQFYPLQISVTLGATNSGPRIGPIVISEINYHPDADGDEFLELLNITGNPVPLFDTQHPTNAWMVNGLEYTFPTNVTLDANTALLLVATNPAAFRLKYNVPENILIFGPYPGKLSDGGEAIELQAPDNPNDDGSVPYVTMDAVDYNNKSPWSAAANGGGLSLQRISPAAFGNEPLNWKAAPPTPGAFSGNGDSDGDGLPDSWEIANGTLPFTQDAGADPDHDGFSNLQEYLAGTNPNDAASFLRIQQVVVVPDNVTFQFLAASNHTYSALYKSSLTDTAWQKLIDVSAAPTDRIVTITNSFTGFDARFYRLVTPAQP
ncbi:MAG TPA: lamin tail domain-containing protein, partial [Verrucomicrobiae bacterium]|nr:lamin tail domain-containing protein [Verrucomicrobiae bacterium]